MLRSFFPNRIQTTNPTNNNNNQSQSPESIQELLTAFAKTNTNPVTLTATATATTMTIARLISKRDWQNLELACANPNDLPPIDSPNIAHAVTSDIVLHFAARFQAPLRTISLLSTLFPLSLERPDATGRYPIHVASKWGATPDVIHFLICSNPTVAAVPDALGKTPMHYVGECYARNYNNRVPYPMVDSMLQVVKLLKTAAPKSMNLEDHEGMNAIEYALESDADIKVIKSMQRACRDDWRDMKSHAGGKSHEELAQELEREAMALQKQLSVRKLNVRRRGVGSNGSSSDGSDGSMPDVATPEGSSPTDTTTTSRPMLSNMKLDVKNRIHIHRSMAKAKTHAARTA